LRFAGDAALADEDGGHPFRGNQYTTGMSGGAHPLTVKVYHGSLGGDYTPGVGHHFGTQRAAQQRIRELLEMPPESRGPMVPRQPVPKMHAVELRTGRVLELEDPGEWWPEDVANQLRKQGVMSEREFTALKAKEFDFNPFEYAASKGYDTIAYRNAWENAGDFSYIPLREANIRRLHDAWEEPEHPRAAKGSPEGGQFVGKGGGYKEWRGGGGIQVQQNPGRGRIRAQLERSAYGELRYLKFGDDVYVWDSVYGAHERNQYGNPFLPPEVETSKSQTGFIYADDLHAIKAKGLHGWITEAHAKAGQQHLPMQEQRQDLVKIYEQNSYNDYLQDMHFRWDEAVRKANYKEPPEGREPYQPVSFGLWKQQRPLLKFQHTMMMNGGGSQLVKSTDKSRGLLEVNAKFAAAVGPLDDVKPSDERPDYREAVAAPRVNVDAEGKVTFVAAKDRQQYAQFQHWGIDIFNLAARSLTLERSATDYASSRS
jgi:hypothetical protein